MVLFVSRGYYSPMVATRSSRVVMIDDQVSYAEALGLALSITPDLEVVGQAADAAAGIEVCAGAEPDLVLCDFRLPDGRTGTEVADALRVSGLNVPIIILTGFPAPQVRREAASMRDVHVLSKDLSITELVNAIRSVLAGSPIADLNTNDEVRLSAGEIEVLELLNQGLTPAEVAERLSLSIHAIRARIKSSYRKLGVGSQVEALVSATRRGLVVPPS